jgi:hypothetical protein
MHSGCIPLITRESGLALNSEAGYLINDLAPNEIADLIINISYDKEKHIAKSFAATKAIRTIEKSYLPDLLKLYFEINENA